MNLNKLKSELRISNADILETLADDYPKLTKICLSMAQHEEEYGVSLCPEAERKLFRKYGRPRPTFWGRKK